MNYAAGSFKAGEDQGALLGLALIAGSMKREFLSPTA